MCLFYRHMVAIDVRARVPCADMHFERDITTVAQR